MSNSKRDKDYHLLRNPEKYLSKWSEILEGYVTTTVNAEKSKEYYDIWKKYGLKSMVGDKRRRNSTRKSNQRYKKVLNRIDRAQRKDEVRKIVNKEL